MSQFSGKFVTVTEPSPHVLLLELNRKPVNAFSSEFWAEYGQTLDAIVQSGHDVRALVIASALPKIFTAGIDFAGLAPAEAAPDPARQAYHKRNTLRAFQHAIQAPARCPFPVIAAVHGPVYGLGMDIICACDVRYAAADTTFSIKEVDVGLAADIGTLAHLPHVAGNSSLARELAYTARPFSAAEALALGLLSRVVDGGHSGVVAAALALAATIASKSPVAVAGTKHLLTHARDHSVPESLEYTSVWNGAMLNTADIPAAVAASAEKRTPVFEPLQKPSSKL